MLRARLLPPLERYGRREMAPSPASTLAGRSRDRADIRAMKLLRQQRRADQQHAGHRDLAADDQRARQRHAAAARARRCQAAFRHRAHQIETPHLQHRQQARGDAGDQRTAPA